jgi:VCBS repeat-containing protein
MEENAHDIGTIVFVSGQVFLETESGLIPLAKGDAIAKGAVIITEDDGRIEIRFEDNTVLSQAENSRISIDDYVYDQDDASASRFLLNMAEGTLRTVTGKIAEQNPDEFTVKSPLATIGIRGTEFWIITGENEDRVYLGDIEPGHIMVVQDQFGTIRFMNTTGTFATLVRDTPMGPLRMATSEELQQLETSTPISSTTDTGDQGDEPGQEEQEGGEPSEEPGTEGGDEEQSKGEESGGEETDGDAPPLEAPPGPQPSDPEQSQETSPEETDPTGIQISGPPENTSSQPQIGTFSPQVVELDLPDSAQPVTVTLTSGEAGFELAFVPPETPSNPLADEEDTVRPETPNPEDIGEEQPGDNQPEDDQDGDDQDEDDQPDDDQDGDDQPGEDQDGDEQDGDDQDGDDQDEGEEDPPDDPPLPPQPANSKPVINNTDFSIEQDSSITDVLVTDADGDALVFSNILEPAHGTLHLNQSGTFSYTPDPDYVGTDQFTATVTDGFSETQTFTVNLTVTPVNDPPTGSDTTISLLENSAYVFAVEDFGFQDTDDGDSLQYVRFTDTDTQGVLSLDGTPVQAGISITRADIENGLLVFTPEPNTSGQGYAALHFEVGDGTTFSEQPSTVTVDVTALSDDLFPEVDDVFLTLGEGLFYQGVLPMDSSQGVFCVPSAGNYSTTGPVFHMDGTFSLYGYQETSEPLHGSYVIMNPKTLQTSSGSIFVDLQPAIQVTSCVTAPYVDGESGHYLGGTSGNDYIHGAGGNDLISPLGEASLPDADHVFGDAGNDYFMAGPGADQHDGGEGTDTIDYSFADHVAVDMAAETASVSFSCSNFEHTLVAIENVVGSHGPDQISGDDNPNVLRGNDGDDSIDGMSGDDILHGDDGNDTLAGNAGSDMLYGGGGSDILDGDEGDSVDPDGDLFLYESLEEGGDIIRMFDQETDALVFSGNCFQGTDLEGISGQLSSEHFIFLSGSEADAYHTALAQEMETPVHTDAFVYLAPTATNPEAQLIFNAGSGTQGLIDATVIATFQTSDPVDHSNIVIVPADPLCAHDQLLVIPQDYTLHGKLEILNPAHDMAFSLIDDPDNGNVSFSPDGSFIYKTNTGFQGHDSFTYQVTNDHGFSSQATVALDVIVDIDTNGDTVAPDYAAGIVGTDGNDVMSGTSSDEWFSPLGGDDEVQAGSGNDIIRGGPGYDTIDGGEGSDTMDYSESVPALVTGDGGYSYELYTQVFLDPGAQEGSPSATAPYDQGDGAVVYTDVLEDMENAIGSSVSKDMIMGSTAPNLLAGNGDQDYLCGSSGNDCLIGGSAEDSVEGGTGNDLIIAGPGDDYLSGGWGFDTVDYAESQTGIVVNLSSFTGTHTGSEPESAQAGFDQLSYTDTLVEIENIVGSGFDDQVEGNDQPNIFWGEEGNDELFGLDDNDSLFGGAGADDLDGGAGSDFLHGGQGNDYLVGGPGQDHLFGGEGMDEFYYSSRDDFGDVIFDFTSGEDVLGIDLVGCLISPSVSLLASPPTSEEESLYYETDSSGNTTRLCYDPDGTGTLHDAVVIAEFESEISLDAPSDIVLYNG